MKTKKIIEISQDEILEHFVSSAENCTIAEARDIIKNAQIFWDIKDDREHEWENKYSINKLEITITQ